MRLILDFFPGDYRFAVGIRWERKRDGQDRTSIEGERGRERRATINQSHVSVEEEKES